MYWFYPKIEILYKSSKRIGILTGHGRSYFIILWGLFSILQINYYGMIGGFIFILIWSYRNEFHIDVNNNLIGSRCCIFWIPFSRFNGNIDEITDISIEKLLGNGESTNNPYFRLTVKTKSGKEILNANRANINDLKYFVNIVKPYLPESVKYNLDFEES